MKKIAIVTGASSGIGKEAVLRLIARGYEVHAAARRTEAMRDIEARGAHIHHLDLTKPESIEGFIGDVLQASGHVDLLVNNAGYGAYGAVEEVPLAAARDQMEVNLFALAHLTQLVLPSMRQRRSGRIINVTSIGGKVWSLLGAWYHASKFAVEGFSDALRNEMHPFGIDVVVVEPGGTKTDWTNIAIENMKKVSGAGPYREFVTAWENLAKTNGPLASPGQIADVIVRAATATRPKTRYVAPLFGRVTVCLRRLLSDRAFDWLMGKLFRIPKSLGAGA